jgi:hypothetical protein
LSNEAQPVGSTVVDVGNFIVGGTVMTGPNPADLPPAFPTPAIAPSSPEIVPTEPDYQPEREPVEEPDPPANV